jgi:hypothetical protein
MGATGVFYLFCHLRLEKLQVAMGAELGSAIKRTVHNVRKGVSGHDGVSGD